LNAPVPIDIGLRPIIRDQDCTNRNRVDGSTGRNNVRVIIMRERGRIIVEGYGTGTKRKPSAGFSLVIDRTGLRYGLVESVVPRDRVHAEMDALAEAIASNGPLATRGTKRIVKLRQAVGSRAARELSDALRSELEYSQDVDEGIAAAREGRKPRFTGK
jgi:Arc/MetJ family transcription regulator